ncbi:MAG: prepilin-type N-terminal cleavage/methylation domain-containing protein [Gammaproteobacteria bacterium]|nr:prepilin-type N-terminal cleavage/methylation domain-containing protein [Gammaproteobacteria bacterium]
MMPYPLFLARCSTKGSASQLLRFEPATIPIKPPVGWVLTQHATSLRAIATQSSPNLGITPDCHGLRPRNDNLFIDRPRNDRSVVGWALAQYLRFEPTVPVGWVLTQQSRPVGLKPNLQKGFTLLEMVLVLFLVGLMASATLMLTEGVEDQAKYDETKRRMDIMRKAIVGNPTRTVNGSPEISGFAVDMERLPGCVRELLEPVQCDGSALGTWSIDASTGIGFGWRGPYIAVLPERNGNLRFRDGYANSDASDALNSGWTYSADASTGIVSVSSQGFDLTNSADDITHNALVIADDWQINSVNINFINQNASDALPASDLDLNLRVYLSDTTSYVTGDDNINTALTISSSAIAANGENDYLFHFDSSNAIPIGARGYAIVCYEKPVGDPNNYVVFDGDCNDASNAAPSSNDIKSFTVTPRQNITLNWVIK